jgi:DNA-binding transcriptional ArsR family regulator
MATNDESEQQATSPGDGVSGTAETYTGMRLDATALKTLAHPLRSRLLSALRVGGAATATDLARRLGTNSGATSYHLRRLESVGLVTDTGDGEGKRRLWRASTDSHQYDPSDFAGDEDAETALSWLQRDYSRHLGEQFERWLDVEHTWPPEWQDAVGMGDSFVIATAEQVSAMTEEVWAVFEKYRRIGQGNPNARRVAVYLVDYPLDLDRAPRGGAQR